jgi:hypothetical protein
MAQPLPRAWPRSSATEAFDEFYTSFLELGLDKGPDGRYLRETLADLAQTNTEGLSDADYYWLEDTGKRCPSFP